MTISNDKEFKAALAALDDVGRRQAAARLVQNVLDLSNDPRVKGALSLVARADASEAEIDIAAAAVSTARVESFTQCGHDTDWKSQAAHFVAVAAQECVKPSVDFASAWNAAGQARQARGSLSARRDDALQPALAGGRVQREQQPQRNRQCRRQQRRQGPGQSFRPAHAQKAWPRPI